MVRNAFMDGLDGREPRPLGDAAKPAAGDGDARGRALRDAGGEEYRSYRHKFSCRLSDEDFRLVRRLRFEHDLDSTTLLHEMIRVCITEGGVDWSRFDGPLGAGRDSSAR